MQPVQIGLATLEGFSRYQFRADGEVISLWGKTHRILAGGIDKDGYRKFVLIDDSGRRRYIRRAYAQCSAWNGPRPDGLEVRHLDGSRDNDAPSNLTWSTHTENCADKILHGTSRRGEKNPRSVITEQQARYIKAHPEIPATRLAAQLRISRNTIYPIRLGRAWAWLEAA